MCSPACVSMKTWRPAMPEAVPSRAKRPGTVSDNRDTVSSPAERSKRPVKARSSAATLSSMPPVSSRGALKANSESTR